jgi:hypothetical protein
MNYLFINTDADRVEEMIPSMSYATLVESLGSLTQLGVVGSENPMTMLVVAMVVDRSRIVRSGMTAAELRRALETYSSSTQWTPVYAVVKALEQAVAKAPAVSNRV